MCSDDEVYYNEQQESTGKKDIPIQWSLQQWIMRTLPYLWSSIQGQNNVFLHIKIVLAGRALASAAYRSLLARLRGSLAKNLFHPCSSKPKQPSREWKSLLSLILCKCQTRLLEGLLRQRGRGRAVKTQTNSFHIFFLFFLSLCVCWKLCVRKFGARTRLCVWLEASRGEIPSRASPVYACVYIQLTNQQSWLRLLSWKRGHTIKPKLAHVMLQF